jgi:hypothetical protein
MTAEAFEQPEYSGIGGWLILVAIGLVLSPLLQAWHAVHLLFMFSENTWAKLTDPSSPAYDHLWKPSLIFEFIGHLFFLCYLIALLVLFFGRSRLFPRLMILLYVCNLVYALVDICFCRHISYFIQHSELLEKGNVAVFRAVLVSLIWIPYFCVSKRVKNTFVE